MTALSVTPCAPLSLQAAIMIGRTSAPHAETLRPAAITVGHATDCTVCTLCTGTERLNLYLLQRHPTLFCCIHSLCITTSMTNNTTTARTHVLYKKHAPSSLSKFQAHIQAVQKPVHSSGLPHILHEINAITLQIRLRSSRVCTSGAVLLRLGSRQRVYSPGYA